MSDRSDMRTLAQGIDAGWQIPADVLVELPARLKRITESGSDRDAVAAGRVLISLLKQQTENLKARGALLRQQQPADPAEPPSIEERRAALLAKAQRLGVTSFSGATK